MEKGKCIRLSMKRDINNKPYDFKRAIILEVYQDDTIKAHILGIGIDYIRGISSRIQNKTVELI